MSSSADRQRTAFALAALLAGSGVLHFTTPGPYRRIVPHVLGHEQAVVAISGVAELVCAAALLTPRTRSAGGWLAAALFIAVFPANVQMAIDAGAPRAAINGPMLAWLRLPLQLPLVWWSLAVARATPRRGQT